MLLFTVFQSFMQFKIHTKLQTLSSMALVLSHLVRLHNKVDTSSRLS